MKIYIEASSLTAKHLSGVGHVVASTIKALQNETEIFEGYEFLLLVPFDRKKQLADRNLGIKIKALPFPDLLMRAFRKFNLLPYMDLLIGKGIYVFPNYWSWPLLFSHNITYIYDLSFVLHPQFVEPRNQKFLANHIKSWIHRSKQIITLSENSKQEIEKWYPAAQGKVKVINCGVDSAHFKPRPLNEITRAKEKYHITGEYLLFVSNIEPRKNISRLIRAYKLLPSDLITKYGLVLVGAGGWNNHQVLADISRAEQEGFHIQKIEQFVNDQDLPALYSGAVALAHPTLYEGFGMTPLEALACGTPVIVGDNSSLREVVGDAGLYVNAEDEQDISDKIRLLLEDTNLRRRLIEHSHTQARQFTWSRSAEELHECLKGLK